MTPETVKFTVTSRNGVIMQNHSEKEWENFLFGSQEKESIYCLNVFKYYCIIYDTMFFADGVLDNGQSLETQ
jgi:hypothetical protein